MPIEKKDEQRDSQLDVELMLKVKKGDLIAFQKLVEIHQARIIGTVAHMLGNVEDAHDVAQQVFIRVWKAAPRYKPKAKFTTWLLTITRNLVFNEIRRRKRHPLYSLEEREDNYHLHTPGKEGTDPESTYLKKELFEKIDQAITTLPEKQRLAVILRRYENLPYEDIAKVLRVSVSAVKSLLFRARTQLKKDLQDYLEDKDG